MEIIKHTVEQSYNNFLFIGEAGSGKSEIAINFARHLSEMGGKEVHFFDMDMTKPLFRSRDLREKLPDMGIIFHHEEQFMDAPTLVGGVNRFFKNTDCYVVMDVGGDYIGARSVGGFAPVLNRADSMIYYVINAYRPWSYDMEHIDQVLGAILDVSHIQVEKLHLISNPNMGYDTKPEEAIEGQRKLEEITGPYQDPDFACVREALYDEVKTKIGIPVLPLKLYLNYPWVAED